MRLPWRRHDDGATAVAEPEPEPAAQPLPSLDALRTEITELSAANRSDANPDRERAILRARHLAGIRLVEEAPTDPQFADPAEVGLPDGDPLPEFTPGELTPELMRAAILRDGCVLVRQLIPRELALELADGIDTAYARREAREAGESPDDGFYDEFVPDERFGGLFRHWIKEGGGLLGADSPRLTYRFFESLRDGGVDRLIAGYLGEPALISVNKTTMRKAVPGVSGAWHQDGRFMGLDDLRRAGAAGRRGGRCHPSDL